MKIAFHLNHFTLRGSEIAVFDYADYNEKLLNNTSLIVVHNNYENKFDYRGKPVHNNSVYEKFKSRFKIVTYTDDLDQLLLSEKVDIFYNLKSGENDGVCPRGVKVVNHCVFTYLSEQAHGDVYIPISPAIVPPELRDITPSVPHIIVKDQLPLKEDARKFYNIPTEAIVYGRHGGEESFNIPFVKETVEKILTEKENIYFLFLNTEKFINHHPRARFIEAVIDKESKNRFISCCDAMLHARAEGESFGYSVAEFSVQNKPIITWKPPCNINQTHHDYHHMILGNQGIYYSDKNELYQILTDTTAIRNHLIEDPYSETHSPDKIMDKFKRFIIDCPYSLYNNVSFVDHEGVKYSYYTQDDLGKTLHSVGWEPEVRQVLNTLCREKVFIDLGSSIGYHSLPISRIAKDVMAIESHPDIYTILNHNIKLNNICNIKTLNVAVASKPGSMYCRYITKTDLNLGSLSLLKKGDLKVDCIDLDSLKIPEGELVIKIDVSGMELEVLKGLVLTAAQRRPFIIFPLESHVCQDHGYNPASIIVLLKALKYHVLCINSNYPADHLAVPIEKYEETLKLFGRFITDNKENRVNNSVHLGVEKSIHFNDDLRVKLMCNWTTSKDLVECWNKMSQGNYRWNNLKVTDEDNDIDCYVIVNKPRDGEFYEPKRTIVLRMEPDTDSAPHWNDWYKSKDDFLYFLTLEKYRNNNEWHLELNCKELLAPITKDEDKPLSTVLSSLYSMEGHKKRIDFIKYIQEQNFPVDVWGRDNKFHFTNYKGVLPYHNKNDAILPYKYIFNAENCSRENYYTEKLIDGILGECLVFYWGCTNLNEFIDPEAYIQLDLNDFPSALEKVRTSIKNNEWEKRIETIKREKRKIIEYYSFFPRISSLLNFCALPAAVINLDKRPDRMSAFAQEAAKVDYKFFTRFPAVDGSIIEMNEQVKKMFSNFPRTPKRGEIGCAMSHYQIWRTIRRDTLILEDDVHFRSNFVDHLSTLYYYVKSKEIQFDVIYIGYHLNNDVLQEKNLKTDYEGDLFDKHKDFIVPSTELYKHATPQHMFGTAGGGTFGYIISPEGASKLTETVDFRGWCWPVDYHMLLTARSGGFKYFYSTRRLVTSPMYEKGSSVDSDVQNTAGAF